MKILLLILSTALISCGPSAEEMSKQNKTGNPLYRVIVIDGCEYLEFAGTQPMLIHKGNCKSQIHLKLK